MRFDKIFKYLIYDFSHIDIILIRIYLRFLKNKFLMLFKPDFASEMLVWERYFHHTKKYKTFKRNRKTKNSILFAVYELEKKVNQIYCLDVGPGPISQFFAEFFKNKDNINIISVDPLAEFYKKIHKKYLNDYDIDCIAGFGETLDKLFPENNFHIVYTQNAIDHSQSPLIFIKNMYYVLKPNGFLILFGLFNEGSNQGWLGLHKWDIIVEGNNLLLSNKNKTYFRYNMLKDLNLKLVFKEISNIYIEGYPQKSYTLIYQKI